jgi:hypothetical protein
MHSHLRGGLALSLLLAQVAVAVAEPDGAQRARRAYAELRYDDARREVDALLARGGLARADLLAAWALAAELACILDGPAKGEEAFRRLLVLDPDYRGPERDTPVFLQPLARARAWVQANGRLRVRHRAPVAGGGPLAVAVEIVADPLAMVSDLRVHWRFGARGPFQRLPGDGLRRQLDEPAPGTTLQYYLEVVDAAGDVLWQAGAAGAPLIVRAVAPLADAPPAPASRRGPPLAVIAAAASSGAFLAGGIAFDVAANREYDQLESSCAPGCTGDDLAAFHRRERAAVGLYAAAGIAAAAAVALWWLR